MKARFLTILGLGLLALGLPAPASAYLVLSLDQMNYSITDVGETTTVGVLVSQNPGGTQVSQFNPLTSAGIMVSFGTLSGIVAITSVTPSPAWDSASYSTDSNNASLGLTSISGISDLSSPQLLGTFTFTGLSPGSTILTVAPIIPGTSFVTPSGNIDPTNTPSATITVGGAAVVPEPSSLGLAVTGVLMCAGHWWRRRRLAS